MSGFLDANAAIQAALRASKREQDKEARARRNLANRAKRRGLPPKVLEQREWIREHPCGFEVGE